MKVLLIYPEYENTFWNVKKVLRLLGKRAAYPPLGMLTVAAMLPENRRGMYGNLSQATQETIEWVE